MIYAKHGRSNLFLSQLKVIHSMTIGILWYFHILYILELRNSHYLQTTHIRLLAVCSARPIFLPTGRKILRKSLQITEFRNLKYIYKSPAPRKSVRVSVYEYNQCMERISVYMLRHIRARESEVRKNPAVPIKNISTASVVRINPIRRSIP